MKKWQPRAYRSACLSPAGIHIFFQIVCCNAYPIPSKDDLSPQRRHVESQWFGISQRRALRGRAGGGSVGSPGGSRGEGGGVNVAADLSIGGLFFFLTSAVCCCFCCCALLRRWSSYLKDGGSVSSVCKDAFMMLGFFCGSRRSAWCCRVIARKCCGIQRRRSTTRAATVAPGLRRAADGSFYLVNEESADGALRGAADAGRDRASRQISTAPHGGARAARERATEDLELSRAWEDGSRAGVTYLVRGSHSTVGRDYLAAQARTAVSAYEPPTDARSSDDAMEECIICLESFTAGCALRTLPCMHRYHQGCIDKWLSIHLSCPLCKNSLGSPTA